MKAEGTEVTTAIKHEMIGEEKVPKQNSQYNLLLYVKQLP